MDMNNLIMLFKNYVYKFDMNDESILRKYYHSLRVSEISISIAKDLNLSEEDIYLAGIIGLLHDYARFPQWTKYHTFSDLKSVDHGDLAVELLFDNNEIDVFDIDKKYYDIIYNAIKYHNKLSIPVELDEKNKLFSNIIRDADKADIMYIFATDTFFINEDGKNINDVFKIEFYKNKLLSRKNEKSSNDKIILDLSMIYDINYKCTFRYIKEKRLIEKFYNNIKQKQLFKEYFDYIISYINERVD